LTGYYYSSIITGGWDCCNAGGLFPAWVTPTQERSTTIEALTLPTSDLLAPHEVSPDTKPFWDATARGELRVQRCDQCGRFRFPPLPLCQMCGSLRATWTRLQSTPSLFSWVIVERSTHPEIPTPYCVALAEFEEGVRIPGNLLYDQETKQLRAGLALTVTFHQVGSVWTPVYRPAD
jgi:uncharacterized OB-fold protein